jgi:hypothetical protein
MTNDVLDKTIEPGRLPGVAYDANGEPAGYSIVEIFDELDHEFVEFYGEYGRRMVNTRREAWNRQGPWRFELF